MVLVFFIDSIPSFGSWTVLFSSSHCLFYIGLFKGYIHFFFKRRSLIYIKAILCSLLYASSVLQFSGPVVVGFLGSSRDILSWLSLLGHTTLHTFDLVSTSFFICFLWIYTFQVSLTFFVLCWFILILAKCYWFHFFLHMLLLLNSMFNIPGFLLACQFFLYAW